MGRTPDKKVERFEIRLTRSQKERYMAQAKGRKLAPWFRELAEAEIDRRQWRAWKKRHNPDPREELMKTVYPGRSAHPHQSGVWCDSCGKIAE